jgi:hypothetical protein
VPIAIIDPHGIGAKREFPNTEGFFDFVPQLGLPPDLRAVLAHYGPAAGRADAARRRNLLCIQTFDLEGFAAWAAKLRPLLQ